MHMADALINPVVGGTMWAATAGLTAYSAKKVTSSMDKSRIPLMGVMGAFVFAAQMINFTIPGTGSSGHIGGGLLLAILLGPYASFITIASILTVQAFFFADGGLLALGSNIFNLGFFPCFVAYPLIFRNIAGDNPGKGRLFFGSILAAVIGLQLGSLGVVLETLFSGITELPFGTFLLLMQPIHLAIGVVEGIVTAVIAVFILDARPDILSLQVREKPKQFSMRKLVILFLVLAGITGGGVSWFASSHPDGLEWAIAGTSGSEEITGSSTAAHRVLSEAQEKTAILPDYAFKERAAEPAGKADPGTSLSGIVGILLTLGIVVLVGYLLKKFGKRSMSNNEQLR